MMSTRSPGVNSGFLSGLTSTAMSTRSNRWALRSTISTWPFVSGSNDPGNSASRPAGGSLRSSGTSRLVMVVTAFVVMAAKERQRAVAGFHITNPGQRVRTIRLTACGALEHDEATGCERPGCRREQLGAVAGVRRIEPGNVERSRKCVQQQSYYHGLDS